MESWSPSEERTETDARSTTSSWKAALLEEMRRATWEGRSNAAGVVEGARLLFPPPPNPRNEKVEEAAVVGEARAGGCGERGAGADESRSSRRPPLVVTGAATAGVEERNEGSEMEEIPPTVKGTDESEMEEIRRWTLVRTAPLLND